MDVAHTRRDIFAIAAILLLAAAAGWPAVRSGDLISTRGDYTQYLARHHHLRTAILKEGVLPQRSHLLGGGYPVIGDPEDPTFNPLSLITLAFGEVMGLKLIGLLHMGVFGTGLFLLLRRRLGLSASASLAAGLLAAASLWVPVRMMDGNPNETVPVYVPLILFVLTGRGSSFARAILAALLFGLMLSDGKLSFVASVAFLLLLAGIHLAPGLRGALGTGAAPDGSLAGGPGSRALWWRLCFALLIAFGLFQFRIQPALELIASKGGLGAMELDFHAGSYSEDTINAYSVSRLLHEPHGLEGIMLGSLTSITVGPVAALLALLGAAASLRRALPWMLAALLCAWLMLAHQAPVDLFRLLWELPVFSAIDAPGKYFSFFPVMTLCILAAFGAESVLRRFAGGRRIAVAAAIAAGLAAFPFHYSYKVHGNSYAFEVPRDWDSRPAPYFAVESDGLPRGRFLPSNANTYLNLRRGVGTLDWYTGISLPEIAETAVVVEADGTERPNPAYRGEAYYEDTGEAVPDVELAYHRIRLGGLRPAGGTVVVNQNGHPDWRAESPVRILGGEGLLRIELPPGLETAELLYSSSALKRGIAWSAGALALLVLLGAVRNRLRSGGGGSRLKGWLRRFGDALG